MIPPTESLTAQGYDLQFGTNVIGPYLFTTLLVSFARSGGSEVLVVGPDPHPQIPALKRIRGRIINTSSSAHNYAPAGSGIEFGSLTGGAERDAFIKSQGSFKAPWSLYGESKLVRTTCLTLSTFRPLMSVGKHSHRQSLGEGVEGRGHSVLAAPRWNQD